MFGKFFKDEGGYALTLMLLFLPVFVGIGLLVVDIGRGNNAQSDLQAAADALALAGARELDGRNGAVDDARAAMERISNRVGFLSVADKAPVVLTYDADDTDGRPFFVAFLRAIPGDIDPLTGDLVDGDDDTPIDSAFVAAYDATSDATTQDRLARYVLVQARSNDLDPLFFLPLTRTAANVPVAATAVAKVENYSCDLAPFFICNPFGTYSELEQAHASGGLYGRLMRLSVHTGGSAAGPGNIGYLRIDGNGAGPTAEALAGKPYDQCVNLEATVDTQPGTVTPAWVGFNTRFDMYANNFGGPSGPMGTMGPYVPAENVRKGYRQQGGNACNVRSPSDEMGNTITNAELAEYFGYTGTTNFGADPSTWGTSVPLRAQAAPYMSDNALAGATTNTAFIRRGSWNLFAPVSVAQSGGGTLTFPPYWQSAYNDTLTLAELKELSNHPDKDDAGLNSIADITALEGSTGIPFVSRFDIYNHELQLIRDGELPTLRAGGEDNLPACYGDLPAPVGIPIDRRTMFVAIVDCDENTIAGAATRVPVDGYAKMFLVRPVDENGPNKTLDMELVDLASRSGIGETEEFLRTEVVLVR